MGHAASGRSRRKMIGNGGKIGALGHTWQVPAPVPLAGKDEVGRAVAWGRMIGREEFSRSKEGNREQGQGTRKSGRLFLAPVEKRKLKMDKKERGVERMEMESKRKRSEGKRVGTRRGYTRRRIRKQKQHQYKTQKSG